MLRKSNYLKVFSRYKNGMNKHEVSLTLYIYFWYKVYSLFVFWLQLRHKNRCNKSSSLLQLLSVVSKTNWSFQWATFWRPEPSWPALPILGMPNLISNRRGFNHQHTNTYFQQPFHACTSADTQKSYKESWSFTANTCPVCVVRVLRWQNWANKPSHPNTRHHEEIRLKSNRWNGPIELSR